MLTCICQWVIKRPPLYDLIINLRAPITAGGFSSYAANSTNGGIVACLLLIYPLSGQGPHCFELICVAVGYQLSAGFLFLCRFKGVKKKESKDQSVTKNCLKSRGDIIITDVNLSLSSHPNRSTQPTRAH